MKICWDNLEGVFLNGKGNFQKRQNIYYEATCKYCGDDCLVRKNQWFCSLSCAESGDNNPKWKDGRCSDSNYDKNYALKQREVNPEKVAAIQKKWRQANPDKCNAKKAKRKARKLNQTPEDANQEKIQNIYSLCSRLNIGAGWIAFHIDHIKPLSKGGLHHEDNLRILPAITNLKKGANYGR